MYMYDGLKPSRRTPQKCIHVQAAFRNALLFQQKNVVRERHRCVHVSTLPMGVQHLNAFNLPAKTSPRRNGCRSLRTHGLPFPGRILVNVTIKLGELTYHLERVEFLFDLLSKHRRQTIACGYFTTSIVFTTGPSVMELDAWAERNVAIGRYRQARPRIETGES